MGLPRSCKVELKNKYEKGKRNLITDVPGVKVGHVTLQDEGKHIHTGVTAVFPHEENLFKEKVPAAVSVINGFGKSAGLIQIEELGNIETPILMTNTFGVGTALNALTRYMLEQNPDIGVTTCTVNGLVTECNDGELNDIRGMHLTEADVRKALETAGEKFEEGAVGGGISQSGWFEWIDVGPYGFGRSHSMGRSWSGSHFGSSFSGLHRRNYCQWAHLALGAGLWLCQSIFQIDLPACTWLSDSECGHFCGQWLRQLSLRSGLCSVQWTGSAPCGHTKSG